jgi:hypothetical protein
MEFFLELIFEFLFQGVVEIVIDVLFKSFGADSRFTRFVIYTILGGGLGAVTLLIWPRHIIGSEAVRYTGLIVIPIVMGVLMCLIGRVRGTRTATTYGLEAFWPGWGFAFAFGSARVLFAS